MANARGALPDEVFFTSGGTEADNWALMSAAELMRHRGRHVITTAVEHDAVLKTAAKLEKIGYEVSYIGTDDAGRIDMQAFKAALRYGSSVRNACKQ